MTFAETHAKIARRKAKYEKLLNSPDMAERTAALLMYRRTVDAENSLFAEQEKQSAPMKSKEKMGSGGTVGHDLEPLLLNTQLDAHMPVVPSVSPIPGMRTTLATAPTRTSEGASSNLLTDWMNSNKLGAAGNTILNGIDYFSKLGAIRQMQEPPKPISIPQTWLNKTLNTGAERNAMLRNRISQERSADKVTDSQVSAALKQKAGVAYLNQLSGVYDKEANYRTQMGNQEAYMNAGVRAQNVAQQNNYNMALNEFTNNKIGARQNALSSLLTNTSGVIRDTISTKSDMMKWALEAMKYDPTIIQDMMNPFEGLKNTNNG